MAYVNAVLTQARIWGQPLYIGKLDIARMLASTEYDFLHSTLLYFGIPPSWAHVFMHQVRGNALDLSAVRMEHIRIFMHQGLIEGSPTSVLAVALLFSRLLADFREQQQYTHVAALEGDSVQEGISSPLLGWLDDWLLFADNPESLDILTQAWATTCEKANLRIKWEKTEVLANTACYASVTLCSQSFVVVDSFKYLGCIVSANGSADKHIEFRGALYHAAWGELCRNCKASTYPLGVKAKLFETILLPILCHGLQDFAITNTNLAKVRTLQNQIQRSFVKIDFSLDINQRWRKAHWDLREMRRTKIIPDVEFYLSQRICNQTFDQKTKKVFAYRDETWQGTFARDKPRRAVGKPPRTLQQFRAQLKQARRCVQEPEALAHVLGQPAQS